MRTKTCNLMRMAEFYATQWSSQGPRLPYVIEVEEHPVEGSTPQYVFTMTGMAGDLMVRTLPLSVQFLDRRFDFDKLSTSLSHTVYYIEALGRAVYFQMTERLLDNETQAIIMGILRRTNNMWLTMMGPMGTAALTAMTEHLVPSEYPVGVDLGVPVVCEVLEYPGWVCKKSCSWEPVDDTHNTSNIHTVWELTRKQLPGSSAVNWVLRYVVEETQSDTLPILSLSDACEIAGIGAQA